MSIEIARPEDAPAIERLATGAGVFTPDEIRVVNEMLDEYFDPQPRDDHTFLIYRNGKPNDVAGFACYGPTPLTDRVWDLYWICVDRAAQRQGIGSELLKKIEQDLCGHRARAIYLETSDSDSYAAAREFYEQHGYERVAHVHDFYAVGDGKVLYRKVLQQ